MTTEGDIIKSLLKRVPLFSGLSDAELDQMTVNLKRQKGKKGAFLFYENDQGKEMYLMVSGLVKVFKSDATGGVKTLSYLREGDFFGEMALLDIETRSASAQFMEDSEVMVLDGARFQKSLFTQPSLAVKMMKTLSARLRDTNKQIEDLTFRNLPGRVASALLRLAEKHGRDTDKGRQIVLDLTHQELADLVGTAREVVTSILSAFKKAECISIEKHHVTILDKNELASWIV